MYNCIIYKYLFQEIADAWNFQFCNSITKSEDLHDRKGTLTNTSDSIQAAQSVTSQQHIISMEDEEVSDSEVLYIHIMKYIFTMYFLKIN